MSEDVDAHIIERYDLHKRLGKGAYGIVWKAVDRRMRETVALKKIFDAFRNQTDAQRTFREVMFLQEFGRHPNIIKLYNVLKADNNRDIYLVFEFMEADLHNVIKKLTILKDIHKQFIMCQLFRAVRFLHSGNVLHRDLKPSNILLDADCRVKLADFGLARSLSQIEEYPEGQNMPELTEYVATRWYRSPEILLAAKCYTKGVDMWSLGCILGEMLLGHALFPGTSTINQIERIMNTIPRPSKTDIESIGSQYASSVLEKMPRRPQKPLEAFLTNSDPQAIDLIQRLLIFAPHKRLNVDQCLVHPYVLQFHSPVDEPALNYDILLPLPDHIQLSVDDYRNKLYEMIQQNKINVRRIQHNRGLSNSR
uniref:Mitogen-activated protein kinase n=1 Tax=Setaria digitata TaxID=48799 RepID=A0A915Q630_9BILA